MAFYDDDGTKLDPSKITKPNLCCTCRKDGKQSEEILCTLTRFDQDDVEDFICEAFEESNA